MDQDAHMRRIIDTLSTDLNNLSSETKRKFPPVKEASEACLLKLRQINSLKTNLFKTMCDASLEVIQPLILGCDTKQPKIIQICLTSAQKVIEARILNANSAALLVNTLWQLTDSGQEEVKVLQTLILLVTTTDIVRHQLLAKALTIGLRLSSSKDTIVMNTATAMLSQMVTKVFDRVVAENKTLAASTTTTTTATTTAKQIDMEQLKTLSKEPPASLNEAAQDAYMLLQDLYLLLNADQALWLVGGSLSDINRPFGLDLLKSVLTRYPEIFFTNPEMCFVLKERICPLLIKLFSPTSAKMMKSGGTAAAVASAAAASDPTGTALKSQAYFATVSRLIRIVFVLIKQYFELLVTESEIFLSLLTKFLDAERPHWQKALAIEVFHKIAVEQRLVQLFVQHYDSKPHPEKIVALMSAGIALFVQSLFVNAATGASQQQLGGGGVDKASSSQSSLVSSAGAGAGGSGGMASSSSAQQLASGANSASPFAFQITSAQPSFVYKDTTIQLLYPFLSAGGMGGGPAGQTSASSSASSSAAFKNTYLDSWDKLDVPYIQDSYLLSVGFATLQELCRTVQSLVDKNLELYLAKSGSANKHQRRKLIAELQQSLEGEQPNALIAECRQLLESCSQPFLFVYNILLESSLDETITENIIKSVRQLVFMTSMLSMNTQRDALVTALCKVALPASYAPYVLNLRQFYEQIQLAGLPGANSKLASTKQSATSLMFSYDDSTDRQIQVVAIGPPLYSISSGSGGGGGGGGSSTSSASLLSVNAKNLLVMKSILNMSLSYADLMSASSWYIIFNTMQHLTWTLGLRPTLSSNGQLRQMGTPSSSGSTSTGVTSASASTVPASVSADQQTTMITTAIQTEIAFICNMFTKLFESTRSLVEPCLRDICDALMQLSTEAGDLATQQRQPEPCVFAVAKLYESCMANLYRIELLWPMATAHWLAGCRHANPRYREWYVDCICSMIKATFNYKYSATTPADTPSDQQQVQPQQQQQQSSTFCDSILHPLHELSSIHFNDIRQKQIDCTLSILRLMGQHLNESWPVCLNIIGAIHREHTEALIRSAFQCLQLVVTDFLGMIHAQYLSLVIAVVAKFGSQEIDLNISLTAIVLLWNISDYMFQNSDRLNEELKNAKKSESTTVTSTNNDAVGNSYMNETIEGVWMCLYSKLGQLCVDPRPAVRKSASQTLFCTISSHGSVLSVDLHWKDLVWKVLFPLLDQVRHFTSTASKERDKSLAANYLMHHSRDTAEKQWAETTVITLGGVTRVFNAKCWLLVKLPNEEFHRMWLFLLGVIEQSALSRNSEIALASLRGFHDLLGNQNYYGSTTSNSAQAAAAAAAISSSSGTSPMSASSSANLKSANSTSSLSAALQLDNSQWLAAWQTWLSIGNALKSSDSGWSWPPPCQTFLTCYLDLVNVVVDKLAVVPSSSKSFLFQPTDFENFSEIVDALLSIPVLTIDYSSFLVSQTDSATGGGGGNLTPLQNSALQTIKNFLKLFKMTDATFQNLFISLVFQRLLSFSLYACYTNTGGSNQQLQPQQSQQQGKRAGTNGHHHQASNGSTSSFSKMSETVATINFVPFGERSLLLATQLYEETASNEAVIQSSILKSIIQTLYLPLSMKYSCPNSSTWKLSIECLFRVLKKAFPIAFKNKAPFESTWMELAKTFEDFLFTKNTANFELTMDAIQKDEMIDCQVIELVRDDILANSALFPHQFIQKLLSILNRGSIYSNVFDANNTNNSFLDLDTSRKLREEFSKTCFEALLRFSFINSSQETASDSAATAAANNSEPNLNKMALTTMLSRCKEIVQRYALDERLNGNIPLPRARSNEMISVLKALCTLINALKKAPKETVQASIWNQVIAVYPSLVECSTSPSPQICNAIKDTLHHYFSLLHAPL